MFYCRPQGKASFRSPVNNKSIYIFLRQFLQQFKQSLLGCFKEYSSKLVDLIRKARDTSADDLINLVKDHKNGKCRDNKVGGSNQTNKHGLKRAPKEEGIFQLVTYIFRNIKDLIRVFFFTTNI